MLRVICIIQWNFISLLADWHFGECIESNIMITDSENNGYETVELPVYGLEHAIEVIPAVVAVPYSVIIN
jgi:hypothetical protein